MSGTSAIMKIPKRWKKTICYQCKYFQVYQQRSLLGDDLQAECLKGYEDELLSNKCLGYEDE